MTLIPILKAFHLFFMIAWFAGIFYLPRLFVYHAMNNTAKKDRENDLKNDPNQHPKSHSGQQSPALAHFDHSSEMLKTMERRLYFFVSPFALLTLIFGLLLVYQYGYAWFAQSIWLHIKLTLVILIYIYHGYCFKLVKDFKNGTNQRSAKFYRIFNELPVLVLLAIIFLAVVKP